MLHERVQLLAVDADFDLIPFDEALHSAKCPVPCAQHRKHLGTGHRALLSSRGLMPKRTDLHSILIIGSGPIVIGQACEFDYSGTQACKAIKEEGYRIILVNSNPATIMTDPEFADRTYIEPLTPETLEQIIEREKPDALLPTVGGQTGINLASALWEAGILQKHGVELIGANYDAIKTAEDRQLFKDCMLRIGVEVPRSGYAGTIDEAEQIAVRIGYPLVIRPSFTLGGTGGGIAYNVEELRTSAAHGIELSPVHRVLVEESVSGWKEFELEVMRDKADNVIIVCSIENFDPMGVHTGDSITVAPQQTLTNDEYQEMRDEAKRIIRAIGVETGGSNIQFAVHPQTGRRIALEIGVSGLESRGYDRDKLGELLRTPQPERIFAIGDAFRVGMTVDEIYDMTMIDPWFLRGIRDLIAMERDIAASPKQLAAEALL